MSATQTPSHQSSHSQVHRSLYHTDPQTSIAHTHAPPAYPQPSCPSPSCRAHLLRTRTAAFCASFVAGSNPAEIVSKFFVPDAADSDTTSKSGDPSSSSSLANAATRPRITEHGPATARRRLPFLGGTFEGREGCAEYFRLLTQVLKVELDEGSFPKPDDFVVDVQANVVSVVGKGRFSSVKTGRGWEERFVYRLSGWDGDGRLGHWEVWADPLSAWLAVGGEEEEEG